ncbi:MAG: hypothetical protein BWY85_01288 [Firmicutes bacterium ADurb.Bin506]|nr:MAG: hypothetical protein BWY85_01288 [Firmicutes bacterium ADurb.Bin506]
MSCSNLALSWMSGCEVVKSHHDMTCTLVRFWAPAVMLNDRASARTATRRNARLNVSLTAMFLPLPLA